MMPACPDCLPMVVLLVKGTIIHSKRYGDNVVTWTCPVCGLTVVTEKEPENDEPLYKKVNVNGQSKVQA